MDSCAGCHAEPAVGGTSPFVNPQFAVANKNGASNVIPFFVFRTDLFARRGLFPIPMVAATGGCMICIQSPDGWTLQGVTSLQPDFTAAAKKHNMIFRIPTPVFGAGLIENIPDDVIIYNMNANLTRKRALNISGQPNYSGNDGTITRFGWKAQNKSPLIFAGEAYNVEQGVTNELFPQERDETNGCLFNQLPEDHTNITANAATDVPSDIVMFSIFMQLLAPPTPAPDTPSVVNGRSLFGQIGCTMCHTPTLTTGTTVVAALSNQPANLYSDLLLHTTGTGACR